VLWMDTQLLQLLAGEALGLAALTAANCRGAPSWELCVSCKIPVQLGCAQLGDAGFEY
jgi:hypothetical protein